MTELQALIIALRGSYEIINAISRRLDQAQADGVISPEQRKRIEEEVSRTDATVDSLVDTAKQALGINP